MKRKLSLLLTMILALTMVMGIGVTAFADPYSTLHVEPNFEYSFDEITNMPDINIQEPDLQHNHECTSFYDFNGTWLYYYYQDAFHDSGRNPIDTPASFSNVKYALISYQIYKPYGHPTELIDSATIVENADQRDFPIFGFYHGNASIDPSGDISDYQGYYNGTSFIYYQLAYESDNPGPNTKESSPAHTHNFRWQTITEPTMYSDGLEGEVCSCGATRNTQPLSAFGYALNNYAVPMINNAKPGQIITLELGEWNSFPKAFMEKVAAKSAQNVTFVFKYKWNHEKQEITIPAGAPVDLNFDWYGPAKMAELYGNN